MEITLDPILFYLIIYLMVAYVVGFFLVHSSCMQKELDNDPMIIGFVWLFGSPILIIGVVVLPIMGILYLLGKLLTRKK